MSDGKAVYAAVALFSFVFAIVFAFIDGMLLWSILFFVLAMMLVLVRIIWNNVVWAEKAIRRWGED